MKSIPFTFLVAAITALTLVAGCTTAPTNALLKQELKPGVSDDFSRSKPEELPGEIEDIQKIPQDVRLFTSARISAPTSEERANALLRFRKQYFSPWTALEPTHDLKQSIQGMKDIAKSTWYGESRLKVKPERIKVILGHADLDRLPSRNLPGIAIAPTFM
ncbi:MAG: hypothetical protein J0653_03490, partial [Deltaproteobacteria bacterium]|nr:hypothetical protein [Deltaproteobacteria bacterium]